MDEKPKIAILILAAGESTRMGDKIKQVLPWKNSTLLGNAVAQANWTLADTTFTVIGAFDEIIKAEVSFEPNTVIQNPDWKNGLGSSIAAGVNHLLSKEQMYDAVLIMLADQPLIDTNYLNKMMGNWKANRTNIVTTKYKNRSGVPAIFGKEHFQHLQKLNKDFGAKDIIASHLDLILALDPNGKEIDIDSWETYQEILNKKNK